jgi:predicted RNase H-like HicB family nuclease
MKMVLTAVCEEIPESESHGYFTYTEGLPGAIAEGGMIEEARANLRDRNELLLEANRALAGKPAQGKKITREKIVVPVASSPLVTLANRKNAPLGLIEVEAVERRKR